MDEISIDDARRSTVVNGIEFAPLRDKPHHLDIRVKSNERKRIITGQTRLYRYPKLFNAALNCIEKARPEKHKRILSAASSIGAEAVSLASQLKDRKSLKEFSIECLDINEAYVRHAKTMQFPKAMLYERDEWLRNAFQESSNPPNASIAWVEPVNEIKESIHIHDPQDLSAFNGDKFDLIFVMTVFFHLTKDQQQSVLENMILHSNGLICMDIHSPVQSRGGADPMMETLEVTRERFERALQEAGFLFADPESQIIKPYSGGLQRANQFSAASIAIHPLIAEMY